MFHSNQEFLDAYGWESECTARVLGALTDESLSQAKAEGHMNLGEIAWHIATAPSYLFNQIELPMPEFGWGAPEGLTAAQIAETYNDQVAKVRANAATVSPEGLQKVYHVFDMMDWPVWQMFNALIAHEIHHRGQISVLMRQAGLVVPSIYGPNAEETAVMMQQMAQGGAGPEGAAAG